MTLSFLATSTVTEDAAAILRCFSRWGHLTVALVIATGVAASVLILTSRNNLDPAADDLRLLVIKVAAVVLMLGLALVNRYRLVPRLGSHDRSVALRLLRRSTIAELALVIGVLGLVSLFATSLPSQRSDAKSSAQLFQPPDPAFARFQAEICKPFSSSKMQLAASKLTSTVSSSRDMAPLIGVLTRNVVPLPMSIS